MYRDLNYSIAIMFYNKNMLSTVKFEWFVFVIYTPSILVPFDYTSLFYLYKFACSFGHTQSFSESKTALINIIN